MMDLFFFLKTLLLTVLLILFLQIKVGSKTLENHTLEFVQSSSIVSPINQAAFGASQLVRDVVSRATISIRKNLGSKKKPDAESLRPEPVSDAEMNAADGPRGH